MKKLFSLLCSIFVLYSATTISQSFADDGMLDCQLTRNSASMVVATMEDSPKKDFSNQTFSISVVAQKINGVPYTFPSCVLRTNLGEGTEEENTYEVFMENYDDPSQPITTYGGQSTFRANGSLGKFKVYCPFIAPDTKQDSVVLSVIVRIACKSYIQSSSQCRIAPSSSFADEVVVESNIYEPTRENFLAVAIRNLRQKIDATNRIFIGYTAPQVDIPQITLGTTSEYRIENPQKSIVTNCAVNGEFNVARATVMKNGVDIRFLNTLESKTDYLITCSDIVTSITSGSTLIPSIMYVTDITSYQYSIATNIFE